ncbi:MAG TPA: hypothetical protein VMT37_16465 [Solirubrobacterales bacterium]|nr:hypothetical protein [Solirubrobacterales bacterium]
MAEQELLIQLYHRCREEMGRYDAQLWQLPSVSYALNGLIVVFVVHRGFSGRAALAASVALLLLAVPLTVALVKNRLFQRGRSVYADELFSRIRTLGPDPELRDVPTTTTEALHALERDLRNTGRRPNSIERLGNWLFGESAAFPLLLGVMLLTHVGQIALIAIVATRL